MKQITREWLAFLREHYPVGSRIRLNSMEDPYAPVERFSALMMLVSS